MRVVFDSPEDPSLPIEMLLLPVVLEAPAVLPTAILLLPVVLLTSAVLPMAVLREPLMFFRSTKRPMAVFAMPKVFNRSAPKPVAVLLMPLVLVEILLIFGQKMLGMNLVVQEIQRKEKEFEKHCRLES